MVETEPMGSGPLRVCMQVGARPGAGFSHPPPAFYVAS